MAELPKPTILPPAVEVVLNQASTEKVSGPTWAAFDTAKPVPEPLKVEAVLVSPMMAPVWPPVTPALAVAVVKPAQSLTVAGRRLAEAPVVDRAVVQHALGVRC